ncbi:unnamed protein product [Ectocarpus sp. CCAP 1310/34]|nr:unnamed protein product [Ectocarpus sp. CCAP 1310/34]
MYDRGDFRSSGLLGENKDASEDGSLCSSPLALRPPADVGQPTRSSLAFKLANMQLRERSAAVKSHAPAHAVIDHPTSSLPSDEPVESPRHAASHASTSASRTEMLLEQVLTLLRANQVVDAAADANVQPPVPPHAPSGHHLPHLLPHQRVWHRCKTTLRSFRELLWDAMFVPKPLPGPRQHHRHQPRGRRQYRSSLRWHSQPSTAPALLQQPLVVSPPPLQRASVLIDPDSATGHIVEPPSQAASPVPQDDAGLPLSSTGARARQEALHAADAAAAEADTIRIQDKMDKLKPEQLDSVTRLPLGPDPDEFARFASSCKGVVTEILNKSDVKRK